MQTANLTGTYHAIVFDCGDTLVHLDPSREQIFCDAAAEIDIALPLTDVARAYELLDFALKMRSSELGSSRCVENFYLAYNTGLCRALGIETALPKLHHLLLAHFAQRRHWTPFPDAAEALDILAKRVPLYVLANWDARLDAILASAKLRTFFHGAHASALLGAEKPDTACFRGFLKETMLDPLTTLYVGNEYVADVVGPRLVGLTPVLIDRTNRMPAADCVRVFDLIELTTRLDDHLPR